MSHYGVAQQTYRVVINGGGLGGAAPQDGFIDNRRAQQYVSDGGSPNSTSAQSLAKARANARYRAIVLAVQNLFNCQIVNFVPTGGSASAAPTAFQFDLIPERSDVVRTLDENNAGQSLVGAPALRRIIARTMIQNQTRRLVYDDPTASDVPAGQDNAGQSGQRRGDTIADVVIGRLSNNLGGAESAITVTAL